MDETLINLISQKMECYLSSAQMKILRATLKTTTTQCPTKLENTDLIALFLSAKSVEGCSNATLLYYENTLRSLEQSLLRPISKATTDDLRNYLINYEIKHGSSKTTIDNIRRIFSSFFSWLEDEDYIVKSPARRIKHVRSPKKIKSVFSDEDLELLRQSSSNLRDAAIINILASTGMRVGELVRLKIKDINISERECLVTGKGNKQRIVYFDARTKIHLEKYLDSREDRKEALFIPLKGSGPKLSINTVEIRLKELGKELNIQRVHPHKFRRTMATNAIDKGMPIEQVQKLLGHSKIDTTLAYAMVNQSNVKHSHQKFIS